MPYKDESKLPGMDAPADVTTELSFSPPEGPFPRGNDNIVTGTISSNSDVDWIAIKLTAGVLYTFTLEGVDTDTTGDDTTETTDDVDNSAKDTILALYDSKGGFIKRNDDIDGDNSMGKGSNLNSSFQFIPPEDGTYYLSASVFTANLGAMNGGAYRVTVLQEEAGLPDPIEGTDMDDKLRGTDAGERITGKGGNDSLIGLGGNDSLFGGSGNDLLVGGMGGDTLSGGPGNDTISYNTSLEGVTINLLDGTARGGDAQGDTLVDRGSGSTADRIENVVGSGQDDSLTGNREGNILSGLAGNDTLDGDEGDDMLHGGLGDDVLDGGDENDTLNGGPGADTLTGGQGDDTVSYAGSMMGVEVRLHSGRIDGGDAKGDVFVDTATNTYTIDTDPDPDEVEEAQRTETVPDVIHLIGSGMADILAGDSRNNTIQGGGGDDMIFGGPGGSHDDRDNADTLHGDGGHDHIFGGKGHDMLRGGHGNDRLVGGSGNDTLIGGPGSDMIHADRDDTTIDGHGSTNGTAAEITKHADDRDTLSYANFTDEGLENGTGITLDLEAQTTADGPDDGTDPDPVEVENINHLIGTAEDDTLTGTTAASETIEGGDDGDTLVGGDTDGTYDTVSYASSDRGVRVELGDGTTEDATGSSAGRGHAGGDTISGFENVMGSAYDDDLTARSDDTNDTATGTQGSTLWGLGGDDTLEGLGGDDTLEGGDGADELDGGHTPTSGTDNTNAQSNTLSYAMSDAGVRVNLAAASASGGHADGDEIETYELTIGTGDDEREIDVATFINLTGSAHDDTLTGDMFGNVLTGSGGHDTLTGAAGGDTLVGGPGEDTLDGGEDRGERNNMVPGATAGTTVAASEDWAVYRNAKDEGVTLDLSRSTPTGTAGEAMGDTLSNIELIWGSKHGDTFIAGPGHDVIHGDGGSDTVSYAASRHGVRVVLSDDDDGTQFDADGPDGDLATLEDNGFQDAADTEVAAWRERGTTNAETTRPGLIVEIDDGRTLTKSYAEGDVLASIENVTVSRDADVITGDGVPNVLKGGGGNDELVGDPTGGSGGNDTLYGGEGDDLLGRTTATPARPRDLNGDGDVEDTVDGTEEATAIAAVAAITDDPGDDEMHGGPGDDKLYGGAGSDTLNGGPGDDDLQGDAEAGTNTDADTFVFTPDGPGSDVILDFSSDDDGVALTDGSPTANGAGDKIDLSAFNIDADDLPGLLMERAGSVILNLEEYGGGRVTIQGGVTLQGLLDGRADPTAGEPDPHLIHIDVNGDEAGVGETVDGVTGQDGVFIL